LGLCLLAWIAPISTVLGQDAEPAPPPIVEPEPEISVPELINRADVSVAIIQTANGFLDTGELDLAEITEALLDLESEISEVLVDIEGDLLDEQGLRQLGLLDQQTTSLQSQLVSGTELVEQEAAELDGQGNALRAEADFWTGLMAQDIAADLPPAMLDRANEILADIADVRDRSLERLNEVVAFRGRISEQRQRLDGAQRRIAQATQARAASFLDPDSPPLWTSLTSDWEPLGETLAAAWSRADNSVRDFLEPNRNGATLFVLLLVPLGLAVFGLQRAVLNKGADTEIPLGRSVFVRWPIAVTLLIWLSLGPEITMPLLPAPLGSLRGLVLTLVLLRIYPVLATERPRAAVQSLQGLFVLVALEPIQTVFVEGTATGRLTNVIVALAGIWFVRRYTQAIHTLAPEEQPHFLLPATWYAGFVGFGFALSLIFNTYGAADIADRALEVSLGIILVAAVITSLEQVLRNGLDIFIESDAGRKLNGVRRYPLEVRRRGIVIVRIIVLLLLVAVLPRLFPIVESIWNAIREIANVQWGFGSVKLTVGNLIAFAIGIVIAVSVSRFIRFALDEDIFPRLNVASGKAAAASRLIYYALLTLGFLFALASAGFELSQLTLLISALGVGIGFGLQGIVNNFVSGLVVAFERPFQVGDMIEVGTLMGRVRTIGLRSSTIRTFDGAEIIVPNANLISGELINWTLSDRRRRIDIPVDVAYGSDIEKVREILLKVAAEHPNAMEDPEPWVLFRGFGDDGLKFELRFWTPDADERLRVFSDVGMQINAEFEAAGIDVPFPQRDLHLRTTSDEVQKALQGKKPD
jgi:small-conductance mechanosensitive channel